MRAGTSVYAIASRQISFFDVHLFVSEVLKQANGWPTVGTPAWCSLAHEDPAKWCALLDAAQLFALHHEIRQQAECEASHAISAAENWSRVAWASLQRANAIKSGAYIPGKAL